MRAETRARYHAATENEVELGQPDLPARPLDPLHIRE
jgi:hypothetical protein